MTCSGYFLGSAFPSLASNIDKAIIVILAFSVVPVAYEWRKHASGASRRDRRGDPAPGRDAAPSDVEV